MNHIPLTAAQKQILRDRTLVLARIMERYVECHNSIEDVHQAFNLLIDVEPDLDVALTYAHDRDNFGNLLNSDDGDFSTFVAAGEDPHEVAKNASLISGQHVIECYAFHLDLEAQLKEHRANHYEIAPDSTPPTAIDLYIAASPNASAF